MTEYSHDFESLQMRTQKVRETLLEYLSNEEDNYIRTMKHIQRNKEVDNTQIYQVLRLSIIDFLRNEATVGVMVENKRIYNTKKIALSGGIKNEGSGSSVQYKGTNQTQQNKNSGNSMNPEIDHDHLLHEAQVKREEFDY